MREIEATLELRRVLALPRRQPVLEPDIIAALTDVLSVKDRCAGASLPPTDEGLCTVCDVPLRLKPLQALALHDIGIIKGGFLSLDVGEGKTLISLLSPFVLNARRPLLILPAHLLEKTGRERDKYARHWLIPNHICLMSYETLGRVGAATWLEDTWKPDALLLDESQKAKALKTAAIARRLARYMAKNPHTSFVAMTGSMMSKSVLDFMHFLAWALKDGSPIPLRKEECEAWALALDEKVDEFTRPKPGALLQMCTDEDFAEARAQADFELHVDTIAARKGFSRRLRETPGVICSSEQGTDVDARLEIRGLQYDVSPKTHEYFSMLRAGKRPDGYDIMEAAEVWRHARELALGYFGKWDPEPPEEWRAPRRAWYAFVREVIGRSRHLDSPEQVEKECDEAAAGNLRMTPTLERGTVLLERWRKAEPTFKPNPVAVWHDESALRTAAKWMTEGPGIVWVEHVPFGKRLATMTGAKYYGPKGKAPDGEFIDDADGRRCVIAAVKANREGRNLQLKWHRNLVTAPPERSAHWQQILGRTHRPLQPSPVVTVDAFIGCAEHVQAWRKSIAGASAIRDTVGSGSKLLLAEIDWPSDDEIAAWSGDRWAK